MGFKEEIIKHFVNGRKKYLPNISVDCVIFGFHQNELKVLLLHAKYANQWALPGGFILKNEHMDEAAKRILKERTGLSNIFLQQFYVFSEPKRSSKKINRLFLKNSGVSIKDSWMYQRFISVGYWALLNFKKAIPVADVFSTACEWFNVDDVPSLILDHNSILKKAIENLRTELNYHPVGYNLLPTKFTMPQLQKLYETILGKKLDRRNFQRKIIATGILKKLEEIKKSKARKAAYLYKFNLPNYQKALHTGMGLEL